MDGIKFSELFQAGSVFVTLVAILFFILKALPNWKEVRLAEIDQRSKDNETQLEVAKSLGLVGGALIQVSQVTRDVAIEQKKATENLKISQRVSSSESMQLSNTVETLIERIDSLEDTLKEQGYETRPKAVKTTRS
jgi:predicted RNase H-like nuclease (RuvC/YqgF family)